MTQAIQPQPGILDIALYQGGNAHLPGRSDVVKLSSNENPFGASPAAVAGEVQGVRGGDDRGAQVPLQLRPPPAARAPTRAGAAR